MGKQNRQTVRTTETTFDIIEALREEGEARLTTISSRFEISKSTVRKHLMTLCDLGYAVKSNKQTYRLSLKFFDLGQVIRDNSLLYRSAVPIIDDLAERTDLKVQILVEEDGVGYYIYQVKPQPDFSTRKGRQVELHSTAAGKAILAFEERDYVERVINDNGLPNRTDHTITDESKLLEALDEIEERGHAHNNEERLRGWQAVGAPILNGDNVPLGSISVSGPAIQFRNEEFQEELPELVTKSADAIYLRIQNQPVTTD